MPFKSEKQRRYMHANHPEIAKRWEKEYKKGGRVQASQGGYIGRYIKGDLGGKKVSNPSLVKYYKGLV
jgi:hypothetical protein